MSILPIFEYTWREDTMPLEACKAACISNCSCSGFFYERQSSYCLSFGDRTSLSNVTFLSIPSDDHIVFVKVQTSRGPGRNSLPVIVSSAVAVPVILTVFILLAIYCMRKLSILDRGLKLAEEELLGVLPTPPTRYSYRELRRYTHHFRQRLGSGGFGSVYEGMLPDGRRVAVKNLETLSHGQKEFLAEIATIGGTSHLNIVNLYGYCLERKHRLLVYEYMENGSLDRWLFCKDEDQFHKLSWETRFKIGLSTARGLAYLHEECPKPILHFDVKPQNILLDENFDAKLADFGLAKLVAKGQSMVNTVVRGTPGYIAPEWVSHSIVSKKCDVYSFGMVLLELVSGRRNAEIELMGSEEYYFPKFAAKKAREGRFSDLIDKRLMKSAAINEQFSLEQVETVIRVALSCIHVEPEMRPSMTVVCGMLEGSIVLPNDVLDFSVYNAPLFEISPSGSIKHHSDLFPTTR
ncbi:hypothetical protein KP509_13G083100 [Ceratopteris richardii]|nr:hypothetical protein KP509_13G083100 [Ceratopteris richardii]